MLDKLEQLTPEEYQVVRKFINSLEPTDFIEMVSISTGWCLAIEGSAEFVEGIVMGDEAWLTEHINDMDKFTVMTPPEDWIADAEEQDNLPADPKGRLN